MCGIIGYIGKKQAYPIIINGLKRLEYRGYDSYGICVFDNENVFLKKKVGRIANDKDCFLGSLGIGHNRWGSVGKVCETNTHPHEYKGIYVVHNGIVENYKELKDELIKKGHKFKSDTDTEVIAHLISEEFKGNLEEATKKALRKIVGSYGIAVISKKDNEKIVVAKLSSPIIIGICEDGHIVSSDASAIVDYTKKIVTLDDNEIAVLKKDDFSIFKEKKVETIDWESDEISKGEYEHFMLKEIMEEPRVIENAIQGRLLENNVKLGGLENVKERLKKSIKIYLIGCGTGYHAAKIGEYLMEEIAGVDAEAHMGSEIRYRNVGLGSNYAAFFVSQSGETADNLASLKKMKEASVLSLGITNVIGSTQTRETEGGVYTRCGPEIAVASTKAFMGQLTVLLMVSIFLGRQRNLSKEKAKSIINELKRLPQKGDLILGDFKKIQEIANKYAKYNNFWFIGRKFNYPVALEGALKLKEISYIHAEGTAGGELKHGPLALIDENCPVFAICTKGSVYDKMISNIEEVKARNGKVIAIATKGDERIKSIVDDVIYIPKTLECLTPFLVTIPLHLFAYYVALFLKRDIDKPRNLAKSVTVE